VTETLAVVVDEADLRVVDLVQELRSAGQVSVGPEAMVTVRGAGGVCYLVQIDDPAAEGLFEDWPPDLLPKGGWSAFAIDHRAPRLAVAVVGCLAANRGVVVGTNFGDIVPAEGLTEAMLRPRTG
jgi:hypothetical protein